MMSGRACTYCLEPDADACVRTQPDEAGGAHVYAHRKCAAKRGVSPLYVFTDESSRSER
ncbi:hypothetical protein AB0A76_08965 [Streptomyces exfoliatus]|uniref:Uncharacterized protein n=1 Tax=Streptomyces exfoliatus TaxID=1905 RepID=A0ABV3CSY5_STREX